MGYRRLMVYEREINKLGSERMESNRRERSRGGM